MLFFHETILGWCWSPWSNRCGGGGEGDDDDDVGDTAILQWSDGSGGDGGD